MPASERMEIASLLERVRERGTGVRCNGDCNNKKEKAG
jgi:hypothetical protein